LLNNKTCGSKFTRS